MNPERLKILLTYNEETGEFHRRERPRSDFSSDRNYGIFAARYAGKKAGHSMKNGYVQIRLDGRLYFAHRLAFLYVHGFMPKEVDHINGDPSNNRISNLRAATREQNNRNCRSSLGSTSKYLGVCFARNLKRKQWVAQISPNREHIVIGRYETEDEAAIAYNEKAKEYFGEFARINVVPVVQSAIRAQELEQ